MARLALMLLLATLSKYFFCDGLVSGWGEPCGNTHDCNDHRYICAPDAESNEKKCVCDRFHEWGGNTSGCLPKFNTTTILGMVVVVTNREDAMEVARGSAFTVQVVAGLFVLVTVLIASFSVCLYCWCIRRKDRALRLEIERMVKQKRKRLPGTSLEV